ncbi:MULTISPECIES: Trp biosynthesis-associated membrane protein [unclassified Ornithinimicrobium]|uniref:Trp biosynthesis-associated membrane protein n=1 Tax=unclassified Ornithinimicrobium TaxID=2615080 RepID=UPI003852A0FB
MNRRAAAAVLLGCGLLLLAGSQPWVLTVREPAPGSLRTRGEVSGSALTPWVTALTLVAAAATLVALGSRRRWPLLLSTASLLGVCLGVVVTALDPTAAPAVGATVSSRTTGWLWVGLLAALLATGGALLATVTPRPTPTSERTSPVGAAPSAAAQRHEAERRASERAWRELGEGRDPTAPD